MSAGNLRGSRAREPDQDGASAVECVCACVCYWRGAEREEQFMVCQRMSEKNWGTKEKISGRGSYRRPDCMGVLAVVERNSALDGAAAREKTHNVIVAALGRSERAES